MPQHHILDEREASPEMRRKLQDSLVLVHGGMAQNVGPILEMVTEKYLLRSGAEWKARLSMLGILDEILSALRTATMSRPSAPRPPAISANPFKPSFPGPATTTPRHSSQKVKAEFGQDFQGFWMLGGMSGGGMGFIFAPERKQRSATASCRKSCPAQNGNCSMPSPSRWSRSSTISAINEHGTMAELLERRRSPHAPGLLCLDCAPTPEAGTARICRPSAAANSTNSPPPAARAPNCAAWCRSSSTASCRE